MEAEVSQHQLLRKVDLSLNHNLLLQLSQGSYHNLLLLQLNQGSYPNPSRLRQSMASEVMHNPLHPQERRHPHLLPLLQLPRNLHAKHCMTSMVRRVEK